MNPSEEQIESTLRHAPQPSPAPGLRDRLVAEIALPRTASSQLTGDPPRTSWTRRWWPALAAAGVAAAALAVVIVQQTQINRLEQTVQKLEAELAEPPPASSPPQPGSPAAGVTVPLTDAPAELDALRTRVGELSADVKTLEAMQAENIRLQAEAAQAMGVEPEMLAALDEARTKAQSIQCVNNLKQLGLAARIWATDNSDVLPPDMASMSNEIGALKILVCSSDSSRQPAAVWASLTPANISYEYLAANGTVTEPQRVAFRCPIHGHVGLADGSVQQRVAVDHPDWLVMQDGKLWLRPPAQRVSPTATGPGQAPQMDETLMRRYGLLPGPGDPPTTTGEPAPAPEDQP